MTNSVLPKKLQAIKAEVMQKYFDTTKEPWLPDDCYEAGFDACFSHLLSDEPSLNESEVEQLSRDYHPTDFLGSNQECFIAGFRKCHSQTLGVVAALKAKHSELRTSYNVLLATRDSLKADVELLRARDNKNAEKIAILLTARVSETENLRIERDGLRAENAELREGQKYQESLKLLKKASDEFMKVSGIKEYPRTVEQFRQLVDELRSQNTALTEKLREASELIDELENFIDNSGDDPDYCLEMRQKIADYRAKQESK